DLRLNMDAGAVPAGKEGKTMDHPVMQHCGCRRIDDGSKCGMFRRLVNKLNAERSAAPAPMRKAISWPAVKAFWGEEIFAKAKPTIMIKGTGLTVSTYRAAVEEHKRLSLMLTEAARTGAMGALEVARHEQVLARRGQLLSELAGQK